MKLKKMCGTSPVRQPGIPASSGQISTSSAKRSGNGTEEELHHGPYQKAARYPEILSEGIRVPGDSTHPTGRIERQMQDNRQFSDLFRCLDNHGHPAMDASLAKGIVLERGGRVLRPRRRLGGNMNTRVVKRIPGRNNLYHKI